MRRRTLLLAALVGAIVLGGLAPTVAASPSIVVRAYFVMDDSSGGGAGVVPVLRRIPTTTGVAAAAVRQLLAGPTTTERTTSPRISTAIPSGTRLLGLTIRDGTATVDLSGRFAAGGGTAGMFARLGQLTWTLTQFSTVSRVRLRLDGRAVTTFSGEGLILPRYLTRATFRDEIVAPIHVDRPAHRAAFASGGRASGIANVFEAAFHIAILDGGRRTLVSRPTMATCGTGCWGRFDVVLRYRVSRAQWGWLRVWSDSARDGSPENVREYRVWLTPPA
jgi:hypothetical protein